VANAQLKLDYTHITAPISGRTGATAVHAGDLVRANDTTPLVIINQVSPIYVSFAVPGRYLGDIRRYQAKKPLVVTARGQASVAPGAQAPAPPVPQSQAGQVAPGQGATAPVAQAPEETGRVSFIDNTVDPTTGTIKLKGTFQNADQGLWPGLFVTVTLSVSTDENVLVVPATAVQPSASGQYVYVVGADRTAQVRQVEVARQSGEDMIISKGLSAGEEVVTDGQLRLTPGSQVSMAGGRGEGGRQGGQGGQGGQGRGRRGSQ
jgi:multidrug efflux system membrane fusion protein